VTANSEVELRRGDPFCLLVRRRALSVQLRLLSLTISTMGFFVRTAHRFRLRIDWNYEYGDSKKQNDLPFRFREIDPQQDAYRHRKGAINECCSDVQGEEHGRASVTFISFSHRQDWPCKRTHHDKIPKKELAKKVTGAVFTARRHLEYCESRIYHRRPTP
jgi:hypothetical protein